MGGCPPPGLRLRLTVGRNNPGDTLRLVFAYALGLSGFEKPKGSRLNLDEPMRHHKLMQTIARD
jgi:hypothetical protein